MEIFVGSTILSFPTTHSNQKNWHSKSFIMFQHSSHLTIPFSGRSLQLDASKFFDHSSFRLTPHVSLVSSAKSATELILPLLNSLKAIDLCLVIISPLFPDSCNLCLLTLDEKPCPTLNHSENSKYKVVTLIWIFKYNDNFLSFQLWEEGCGGKNEYFFINLLAKS